MGRKAYTERNTAIVRMWLVDGLRLRQIAEVENITYQRVQQIIREQVGFAKPDRPKKHYQKKTPPVLERFLSRIETVDGHWLWRGNVGPEGFGRMVATSVSGSRGYAHRLSWILHHGEIPEGKCVLHSCEYLHCVNPDHLFLGDHQGKHKHKRKEQTHDIR